MIRKLRAKMVTASVFSLLAVLIVILSIAAGIDYHMIVKRADETLQILKENDGVFPKNRFPEKPKSQMPKISFGEKDPRSLELPYESRYFTVFIKEDGMIVSVNTGRIAAVDSEEAVRYADRAMHSKKTQGFLEDYRYLMYTKGEETHLIFLDCGRILDNFRRFVGTSILVSILGVIAVLLLLIKVSERMVKPFVENYEKQKRFITDAGHELKTPLTIITADTEILRMDYGDNEWLKDIDHQAKRLAELTGDLITLSRMEEEDRSVPRIPFSLSDVAEETVAAFRSLATVSQKTFSAYIEPMISMTGDEKAIAQLISILLDNAMKYSDENGLITFRLEKKKKQIELTVYNTTTKLEREETELLFERFFRTDKSRNSKTGGYGLGLSIAKAIVDMHKGKIKAETEDEKSLRITVWIPE